ncbi:MAG: hypothetical protein IJW29_08600 [Clostridia bacterium]|nr:hypothetical protein [Clostridia bacterium]
MKKIFLCMSLLATLVILMLSMSSCGFASAETLEIESIKAEKLDDGSGATRITIKYFDDIEEPLVFDIPMGLPGEKGDTGEAGVGIKGVEVLNNQDGTTKTIVFSYTDPTMGNTVVPVENGVSVVSAERIDFEETVTGEDGEPVTVTVPYMVLTLSDGKTQKVRLPDGVRGAGVSKLRQDIDPVTGETVVIFGLENGEELTPVRIQPGARGKSIDRVMTEPWIEDGETLGLTLKFYLENSDQPLASVNLPHGEDGVGIGEIKSSPIMVGEKKVGTKFYFELSDGSQSDEFEVMDGIGIVDIKSELQVDGSTKVTVFLSDETSTSFSIPAAVSISDISVDVVKETGDTIITIHKTKGDPVTFTVKKAVGIANVNVIQNPKDTTQYVMVITYTDGNVQEVSFDKPVAWHHGNGDPKTKSKAELDANFGDYYFDFSGHKIYYNDVEDGWQMIVDMNTYDDPAKITFEIKSSENESWSKVTDIYTFDKLTRGSVFANSGYSIPVPTKKPTDEQAAEGITSYRFLGWCTSREPDGTNGFFTDLTVIPGDLTLYPVWEAVYG